MKYGWQVWGALVMCISVNAQENYAQHAAARAQIQRLAVKENMDESYLLSLLAAVERDEEVLRKISKPAEKTKTWGEYRPIFLDQSRIDNGVKFWHENRFWLELAHAEYGVDPAIIVAILGVETRYGRVVGTTPVWQALATLCFDYPPRAKFFCEQVDYFLKLARRENFNPLQIKGSYAGAMGMAQFMPSSYYRDAIDFDGDNKIDLWGSAADAIGSIAKYLFARGWQTGSQEYVYQLPVKPALAEFGKTHKPALKIRELTGVLGLEEDATLMQWINDNPDALVGSLRLQAEGGESYWLTFHNFSVITRYNTSPLYAMAVVELSQAIRANL